MTTVVLVALTVMALLFGLYGSMQGWDAEWCWLPFACVLVLIMVVRLLDVLAS